MLRAIINQRRLRNSFFKNRLIEEGSLQQKKELLLKRQGVTTETTLIIKRLLIMIYSKNTDELLHECRREEMNVDESQANIDEYKRVTESIDESLDDL